jgi:chaperonin cofactor prefoldin
MSNTTTLDQEIAERLAAVQNKLEDIAARLDKLEQRLDECAERFEAETVAGDRP